MKSNYRLVIRVTLGTCLPDPGTGLRLVSSWMMVTKNSDTQERDGQACPVWGMDQAGRPRGSYLEQPRPWNSGKGPACLVLRFSQGLTPLTFTIDLGIPALHSGPRGEENSQPGQDGEWAQWHEHTGCRTDQATELQAPNYAHNIIPETQRALNKC